MRIIYKIIKFYTMPVYQLPAVSRLIPNIGTGCRIRLPDIRPNTITETVRISGDFLHRYLSFCSDDNKMLPVCLKIEKETFTTSVLSLLIPSCQICGVKNRLKLPIVKQRKNFPCSHWSTKKILRDTLHYEIVILGL
jgi:hypothetical protein